MPRSKDVDAWLERYDNPMKDVVLRVREIVLHAGRLRKHGPAAAAADRVSAGTRESR